MGYTLMAYSSAYPFITQRLKASVRLETDPMAILYSQIDTTSGHPQRTWTFTGLTRTNYRFVLESIDDAGVTVSILQVFSVVPGEVEGQLERADEQVVVGVTPNFDSFTNEVLFDGSNSSPDYRGWDIVPSELTGRGILDKVRDYTWDQDLGKLTLVQSGDVFTPTTTFNIHFNPKLDPTSSSDPVFIDFSTILLTSPQELTVEMFGNTVLIELVGIYGEFTLPPIETVPAGRPIDIEVGGSNYCVRIKQNGSDVIKFLRGNIFIHPNEKVSIYKFKRPDNSLEWRVKNESPNFHFCGLTVFEDSVLSNTFNRHYADGSIELVDQYARLYNEVVLNLPSVQVCNFDSWDTGNNKYLYSLANSSNPIYTGKFHFPFRKGLYIRSNDTGKAGDYQSWTIPDHKHQQSIGTLPVTLFGKTTSSLNKGSYNGTSNGPLDYTSGAIKTDGSNFISELGNEVRPVTVLLNQYILY